MTGLLEKALRRMEALSQEEQDAVASQILESLDDEEAWARSFREKPELLRSLAQEGSTNIVEERPVRSMKRWDEIRHNTGIS